MKVVFSTFCYLLSLICFASEAINWQLINAGYSVESLLPSLDWRNINGKDFTTPVKNQLLCGSCVIFATTAAIEAQLKINHNTPDWNLDLSEEQFLTCSGSSCNGWSSGNAAMIMPRLGITSEGQTPYKSGPEGESQRCDQSFFSDPKRYIIESGNFLTIEGDALPEITSELQQLYPDLTPRHFTLMKKLEQGPIIVEMVTFDDFILYRSGVYQHRWGQESGGHALLLIGYNLLDRYWIVKNSWGQEWGENGYGKVSMDQDENEVGFAAYAYQVSMPFVNQLIYRKGDYPTVITGETTWFYGSNFKKQDHAKLIIESMVTYPRKDDSIFSQEIPVPINTYSFDAKKFGGEDGNYAVTWSPKKIYPGRYKAYLETSNGLFSDQNIVRSEPVTLFIPTEKVKEENAISIKGIVDEKQVAIKESAAIRGRVFIKSSLTYKSSPPERVKILVQGMGLSFFVKNETPSKTTFVTLRTQILPNGSYQLTPYWELGSTMGSGATTTVVISNN